MPFTRPRVLVVDDDPATLTLIGTIAMDEGFEIATAATITNATRQLRQRQAELVLIDITTADAPAALRGIRDAAPQANVVLMSRSGTAAAVEMVQRGARDYLHAPDELPRLKSIVAGLREESAHRRALLSIEADVAQRLALCGMVGRSPAMQDVFAQIRRLAPHARITLITGGTGSGKTLAAQVLHQLGPRRERELSAVSCAAVVETLFDSELFGHVRGAFQGANADKIGLFEHADGGTVFLDDVDALPPALQGKLLRVLQRGEVQRAGSSDVRAVDVHVIAATSRSLNDGVAAGRFNADLYDRLKTATISVPLLRDRPEDLPYLAAVFVRNFAERFSKPIGGLTPAAERLITTAVWDGNVAQLRRVLERACMLADGEFVTDTEMADAMRQQNVAHAALPMRRATGEHPTGPAPLADIARDHILRTLDAVKGNKAVAARLLGLSRRAFYRQLERHGLHTRVPAIAAATRAVSTQMGPRT
jgi:DNA-binding NtrC family response regulator